MPRWMLSCPNCRRYFLHEELAAESNLIDSLSAKPIFPYGGQYAVCPICARSSLYQSHALVYKGS
jgi:uncharacterized protein (DUF2225 family)